MSDVVVTDKDREAVSRLEHDIGHPFHETMRRILVEHFAAARAEENRACEAVARKALRAQNIAIVECDLGSTSEHAGRMDALSWIADALAGRRGAG